MARIHTFDTPFALTIWEGDEHEFTLRLRYHFTPGYADTYEDPGCGDSVEIVGIRLLKTDGTKEYDVPPWMQDLIDADESLAASLIADAAESNQSTADDYAEMRAEEVRNERRMGAR